MKHIKGMLVLSDYLFWLVVRQIKSQQKQTTSGPQEQSK